MSSSLLYLKLEIGTTTLLIKIIRTSVAFGIIAKKGLDVFSIGPDALLVTIVAINKHH